MPTNERGYAVPTLATDAVLVQGDKVLLVSRGRAPHEASWALPGGFVEVGETTEAACLRELREETGCAGRLVGLVGVYSDPGRDPRGHVVSVTYLATPQDPAACQDPTAGDDAAGASWFDIEEPPQMAFDHGTILEDARRALQALGTEAD